MAERTEKFFTWVWRINGIIVLVAAVICLVGLAVLIADISGVGRTQASGDELAQVAGANSVDEDLQLGGFRRIGESSYMYATLAAQSGFVGSGSGRGNARNWLFFNVDTRQAHWVFADSSQEIVDQQFLYQYEDDDDKADSEREKVPVGILMLIAEADSEDEPSETRRLVLVSTDGKKTNLIAERVDRLRDYFYVDRESHLVLYSAQGSIRILDLNPISATVTSDEAMSIGQ